jgi:hypothetical protein
MIIMIIIDCIIIILLTIIIPIIVVVVVFFFIFIIHLEQLKDITVPHASIKVISEIGEGQFGRVVEASVAHAPSQLYFGKY